jgi:hypothetical protein
MKLQFQNAGIKGVQIKFYRKGTILRIIDCDEELEQASIFEIMFADDIEFVTGCAEELQQMLHIFDKIVTDFGGRINTSKTKVMMVVPKGAGNEMPQPQIYVKGVLLECVEEYKYLGTLETEDNMLDKEISVRCQKMKSAYNRYAREIFQGHLDIRIKVNLFNLMVVTNGLYGCQVWNLKDKHLRALEATFFSLIRRVFGRYKCDWSRVEIIQYAREHQLSIYPMEWRIAKLQLRYIAHEIRIPEDRVAQYPHTMLLRGDIISENPRVRGRPEHKYADTIRRAAKTCGITDMEALLNMSLNRVVFKKYMKDVACEYFINQWLEKEIRLRNNRHIYEERCHEREQSRGVGQTDGVIITSGGIEASDKEDAPKSGESSDEYISEEELDGENTIRYTREVRLAVPEEGSRSREMWLNNEITRETINLSEVDTPRGQSRTEGILEENERSALAFIEGWNNEEGLLSDQHRSRIRKVSRHPGTQHLQILLSQQELEGGEVDTTGQGHVIFDRELDELGAIRTEWGVIPDVYIERQTSEGQSRKLKQNLRKRGRARERRREWEELARNV